MTTPPETPREKSRQMRYYEKREQALTHLAEFQFALESALDRGRCPKLLSHLPEDPSAWLKAATAILNDVKLIACKRDDREAVIARSNGKPEPPPTPG